MKIAEVLTKKLTPKELSELCDVYDDGTLDNLFWDTLIPRDCENNPDKYTTNLLDQFGNFLAGRRVISKKHD